MQALEWLGRGAGALSAPLTGSVAWLRRARTFHPSGVVHRVDVRVHPRVAPALRGAAERLHGRGIARLSSAWWKQGELPDLLGVGIRIGDGSTAPQDLLFATARSIVTLLPGALTTDVHDFLNNTYFSMAPFHIDDVGRARLRLRPRRRSPEGNDRNDRLLRAIADGVAILDLEVRRGGRYQPFAEIALGERVELDDQRLELSPEHAGRGIRPVGFINATRRAAYAASRRGRTRR